MPDMKCPFREKDGEFADCYGKTCMLYFEMQTVSFEYPDNKEAIPMCRKIEAKYGNNMKAHIAASPYMGR